MNLNFKIEKINFIEFLIFFSKGKGISWAYNSWAYNFLASLVAFHCILFS